MNLKQHTWTAAGIGLAILATILYPAVQAQENDDVEPAKLGDAARSLGNLTWVQGEAVDPTKAEGDSIYVVEFWATWCGPCRASVPHLDELYDKYKDQGVKIVGISVDDDAEAVKQFVADKGDEMSYTVAHDPDREASRNYMLAFAKTGIPQAFVIDTEGKIVWEGHPMVGLDEAIEKYKPKKEEGEAKAG